MSIFENIDDNDDNDDNDIKLFKCTQCNVMKKTIIWKNLNCNPGSICSSCWKIYNERVKEIYSMGT